MMDEDPKHQYTRQVGIDIRARSFGYIVLERMAVLDCGMRQCELGKPQPCLRLRFRRILSGYAPTQIIVRAGGSHRKTNSKTLQSLKAEANRMAVPFVIFQEASLRRYFLSLGARNKRESAKIIVQLCPELTWKLPPKRKPWQGEDERLSIFDAAAAVIAYRSGALQLGEETVDAINGVDTGNVSS